MVVVPYLGSGNANSLTNAAVAGFMPARVGFFSGEGVAGAVALAVGLAWETSPCPGNLNSLQNACAAGDKLTDDRSGFLARGVASIMGVIYHKGGAEIPIIGVNRSPPQLENAAGTLCR
jgi:hypothetical protein